MKCHLRENSLRVSGIKELSAANAKAFRDSCHGMISSVRNSIDVDLSETAALVAQILAPLSA